MDPSLQRPAVDGEDEQPGYEIVRGTWKDRWKDRWNHEVEETVRWVQGVKWAVMREEVEGRTEKDVSVEGVLR